MERLTPQIVFTFSLLGFLPVIGIFALAGNKAGEILTDPHKYFELVRNPSPMDFFWMIAGNLGDAVGYYLIILPIAVALLRQAQSPLGRASAWLIGLYGVNGAFWAIVSAVALPIAGRDNCPAFGYFILPQLSIKNQLVGGCGHTRRR